MHMKLNNSSQKPLYMQLKQIITEDIARGKYKTGSQLPPEAEICERYGVSRITVRRAIADLVKEGILHRQQGKGTFVREHKVKRELFEVGSFSEHTTASGKTPSSQILSNTVISADEELAKVFRQPVGAPLLRLHRLLFIDQEPFIIETSYYPLTLLPDLEKYIGEFPSTYNTLKQRYGINMTRFEKRLEVVYATPHEAELFMCDHGTPMFLLEKLTFDQQGRAIHLSKSLMMTSKVVFTLEVDKSGAGQ